MFNSNIFYNTGSAVQQICCVVQCFTTDGTWSCCPGAFCIEVVAVGGGAGGNSGGRCTPLGASRLNYGGAGGGGGGLVYGIMTNAQIPASACVVIGQAGAGAPGRSTNGNGFVAANGGTTCFGTCLCAIGGCARSGVVGGGPANAIGGTPGCPGLGGSGVINGGTGTVYNGNCGGAMSSFNACAGLSSCVGGRGGAGGPTIGMTSFGSNASGGAENLNAFGICLGQGGCSNTSGSPYGAGGGGGRGCNGGTTPNGGNGTQGIVMVTTYF